MNTDYLKNLIQQVIDEMSDEEEILTSETNIAGDVAGYDAPIGVKTNKRKLNRDNKEKVIDE